MECRERVLNLLLLWHWGGRVMEAFVKGAQEHSALRRRHSPEKEPAGATGTMFRAEGSALIVLEAKVLGEGTVGSRGG